MKRLLATTIILLCVNNAFANHITGGQIYYTYKGMTGNNHDYSVTLLLYRDSLSTGAQLDNAAAIGIFDKSTGAMVWTGNVVLAFVENQHLRAPGPCITNPPTVIYQVGHYNFDISLPPSSSGYVVTYQRCCRIAGITNLSGSSNVGATYTADIPGTNTVTAPIAPQNNSARFVGSDTVVVCGGYPFTYSFAAVDPDPTDQLVYSFCDAYVGGGQAQGTGPNSAAPNPPAGPPYSSVPYSFPFNGAMPLGNGVNINTSTGLITGVAPASGIYVVTVCVTEIRNGIVIATQRKDLQIKAGDCDVASATLDPQYITCDGFNLGFFNLSNSPLINSYYWDFGDPTSGVDNTSTSPTPPHTFTAAGQYTIKLVTNRGQECSDSTTATVGVWPGFVPNFNSNGVCRINPVLFTDASTTAYGVIDSWRWDFGEQTATNDTSRVQNPSWTYATTGSKDVRFIVTNSKGCVDTLIKTISIIDKPPITLAFKDTLICVPDAVQLSASGPGTFSWTPAVNIVNANSATPTVNPTTTTSYIVQLNEQGCINTDTVRVRVVNFVTLQARPDAIICLTDTVHLSALTDGLQYSWTPAASVSNPTLLNTVATPTTPGNTTYFITSRIGSCSATDNVTVTAVPYPVANAGPDTTICYNTSAVLHGSHNGVSFTWSPTTTLTNFNTLTPTAHPSRPTEYILSVLSNQGCPKAGRDTVLVTVLPKINADAGNDTLVVVNQPLQFNAEGGVSYQWIPGNNLNNPMIANPIGVYGPEIDSITYKVLVFDQAGCMDSAYITVKVFKTDPYVFVPTAFTPNGDGLNDLIRPIAVGIKQINYFAIYNRWGQLVFKTSINGHGWDGRIAGVPQGTNVFVWMVSAEDYTGKKFFRKGTVTLIR
jgi:gliding motility-associated-like protein